MNLQEASTHITHQLQKIYSLRESQNICNLLLEEITTLTRAQRIVNITLQLTTPQANQLHKYLVQLLQHKPIQQILGYTWFANHQFLIDDNVLIPRQETEELVELIINENKNKQITILDIGTGSGCIAITLKKTLESATITAIDISNKALAIAKQNAKNIDANINFIELDFLNKNTWATLPSFDVIVSNPPYISTQEKLEMHKNVLNYEPHLALFPASDDVLIFYKKIAEFATTHLNKAGNIYVEINETLAIQTAEAFANKGFKTTTIKDMQEKNRIIKATAPQFC